MSASNPTSNKTLAEANRAYFDHISGSYDEKPWFAKVNQQVTDALRSRLDWLGIPFVGASSSAENVRLLDYACGTGLLSRVYGPYVTVTRGIDISPNMVETYNARARAASISESTTHAVVGDLFDKAASPAPQFSAAEWTGFDLAACGFAFHHFEDVVHSARRLKERLRPGGALVITDFLEGGDLKADDEGRPIPGTEGNHAMHHHHHHHHHHGHGHGEGKEHSHGAGQHGGKGHDDDPTLKVREEMNASIVTPHFTIDHVRAFFTEAGFVDVDVVAMEERVYMEFAGQKLWRTILFGKGRRPFEEKSEL